MAGYAQDGALGAVAGAINSINPFAHVGISLAETVDEAEKGNYKKAGEHGYHAAKGIAGIAAAAVGLGVKTSHYQGPRAAPEKSISNSIWETKYPNGNRRVTYFDEHGKPFSREDYGQQARHIISVDGQRINLKNTPHEHQTRTLNGPGGPYLKNQVRVLDTNGNPTSGWINEK